MVLIHVLFHLEGALYHIEREKLRRHPSKSHLQDTLDADVEAYILAKILLRCHFFVIFIIRCPCKDFRFTVNVLKARQ